jgi:hypothetical protein
MENMNDCRSCVYANWYTKEKGTCEHPLNQSPLLYYSLGQLYLQICKNSSNERVLVGRIPINDENKELWPAIGHFVSNCPFYLNIKNNLNEIPSYI